MAVSVTGSDFSSLDAFNTILHKLAVKDFTSKRLPQHCAIRKQIKALLQSSVELQHLSAALHKDMFVLVLSLPVQNGRHHSFQVALWPHFHHLCMQYRNDIHSSYICHNFITVAITVKPLYSRHQWDPAVCPL